MYAGKQKLCTQASGKFPHLQCWGWLHTAFLPCYVHPNVSTWKWGAHGWCTWMVHNMVHMHSLDKWFTGLVYIQSSQVCMWVLHSSGAYAGLLVGPQSLDELSKEMKALKYILWCRMHNFHVLKRCTSPHPSMDPTGREKRDITWDCKGIKAYRKWTLPASAGVLSTDLHRQNFNLTF